jgi:hypothetical protein
MPVGLSLLDGVEKHLQSEGLLPTDASHVHRIIDFSSGHYSLRWTATETGNHLLEVKLEQQLAESRSARPVVRWSVTMDKKTDESVGGQVLLESSSRVAALSELIAKASRVFLSNAAQNNGNSEAIGQPVDEEEIVPAVDEPTSEGELREE